MSSDEITCVPEYFNLELKNQQQRDIMCPKAVYPCIKIEGLLLKDEFGTDASNSQYMDQQRCNFDEQVKPDAELPANFDTPCENSDKTYPYIKMKEELIFKDEFDMDAHSLQYMDKKLCSFDEQVKPDAKHSPNFDSSCSAFLKTKARSSFIGAPGSGPDDVIVFKNVFKKEFAIEENGDNRHFAPKINVYRSRNASESNMEPVPGDIGCVHPNKSTYDSSFEKNSLKTCSLPLMNESVFIPETCSYQTSPKLSLVRYNYKHTIGTGATNDSYVNHERHIIDKSKYSRDFRTIVVGKPYRSTKKFLLQGQDIRNRSSEKSFTCKICDYRASQKSHLIDHMNTHIGKKPFKCEICDYRTSNKNNLIYHNKHHTGGKRFKCELCDYVALQKSHLTEHLNTHTGQKPFNCEICHYRASRKSTLMRHIKTHTGDKPFKCELCDYSAVQKSHLLEHVYTHTGAKPFECEMCHYRTSQKSTLLNHIKTHIGDKPFKCEVCDYSASQKIRLIEHVNIHTGANPFKCEICDYGSSRKSTLIRHVQTHTREKLFKCEMCDYRASNKKNWIYHNKHHKGEKPFKCEICDYSALQKSHLTEHVNTHTGQKPFNCEICHYRASRKSTLINHVKTHTRKRPFNCEMCNYVASRKIILINHIKTHKQETI